MARTIDGPPERALLPVGAGGLFYTRHREPAEGSRRFGPLTRSHPLVNRWTCPGCGFQFQEGDAVTLIPIGPGNDPEELRRCHEGAVYNAVAVPVHWTCAGNPA